MKAKNNQNIFDFALENFGTFENLFSDVLVDNSLAIDDKIKPNQEININTSGKGNETVKNAIQEQGLVLTNGEIESKGIWILAAGIWDDFGVWIDDDIWID